MPVLNHLPSSFGPQGLSPSLLSVLPTGKEVASPVPGPRPSSYPYLGEVCWGRFCSPDSCTPNQPGTHRSRSFWSQSRCRSPRWWSPGGPGRRRGCPELSGSQSGLAPRPFPVTPTPRHTGRAPELRPALPTHPDTPKWPGTSSPPPHSLLLLRVGVPLPLPCLHLLSLCTGAQTGRALTSGRFLFHLFGVFNTFELVADINKSSDAHENLNCWCS